MIDLDKLKNGYVSTGNKKLARMFFIECLKHDELSMPIISSETFIEWAAIAVNERGTPCGHGNVALRDKVELTEDDFNPPKPPRTKVEYVKCEFNKFSDAVLAFEDGPLYCIGGRDIRHYKVSRISTLTRQFEKDNLYSRTEVEIDWRLEVEKFLFNSAKITKPENEKSWNFVSRFKYMSEMDYLEMCRVALRATGELTDKPE